MDLLFLGTGSGVPAKHRNVSSIALKLLEERNSIWMFDCGEATQHQILNTTLKPRKIEKIFITHMHGDHIFGLPGMLSSRAFQGGETPLTIYGPKGIKQYVLSSFRFSASHIKYPINFIEFNEEGVIFQDNQFKVIVKKLKHGIPSYGFRIEESDHEGTLLAENLKDLGVPFGPLFGKLKNGETVTLQDGRVIDGKNYIGPTQKGRIVTILGDTLKTDNSIELSKDTDVLVHESTFNHSDIKLATSYNHSTNVQAAMVAKEAKAKMLLLTHISARYLTKDVQALQKEARAVFKNTHVMYDLKEINIPLEKTGAEY
ncbi:ribonuclease Z [Marinilactibacillus psychrotolerans]|uniref:Ribonuclease Z n=1 Tax=Marinilactibacillus psychrotolerans TaxID=191770 RepID=A0AAV3WTY0_9LACT|nr:ribonuclease Z [Marinilactibacillus psychrotolerans]GEL67294.1 ribonuclease Z [Marinilactibacillus psychrotolerans]GEQ36098.1 ribonuclease Z [Marinilactibacillus psychrotolerans]SDC63507.1 RNAse Z [Marinilactibacillus psychrotolerans]